MDLGLDSCEIAIITLKLGQEIMRGRHNFVLDY